MGESAELFEMTGRARQFGGHPAKLVGLGAVVRGRDDILGRAAKLEEPVEQGGDLGVGQHDGVFGQPCALHRRPPLVGALAAGLPAVPASPTHVGPLFEYSSAPTAMLTGPPPHSRQNVT